MTSDGSDLTDRVIERLTSLAEGLGLNPVRVRWKLLNLRQRWRDSRHDAATSLSQPAYRHRHCPRCRALQSGDARRCSQCDARLGWRGWDAMAKVGFSLPEGVGTTALLIGLILLAYLRTVAISPDHDLMSFSGETLVLAGGNWSPLVHDGQWWRLGTAVLLHGGLLHLLFNLMALSQVAPAIEGLFGRAFLMCSFMATGVIASLGSLAASDLYRGAGVSIGASGALMGLCGLAAGWGQADGTTAGRDTRNLMLKWALYTVLFGFFLRADNAAHVVGFVAGGVLGLLVSPDSVMRRAPPSLRVLLGALGGLAALACLFLIVAAPRMTPLG